MYTSTRSLALDTTWRRLVVDATFARRNLGEGGLLRHTRASAGKPAQTLSSRAVCGDAAHRSCGGSVLGRFAQSALTCGSRRLSKRQVLHAQAVGSLEHSRGVWFVVLVVEYRCGYSSSLQARPDGCDALLVWLVRGSTEGARVVGRGGKNDRKATARFRACARGNHRGAAHLRCADIPSRVCGDVSGSRGRRRHLLETRYAINLYEQLFIPKPWMSLREL